MKYDDALQILTLHTSIHVEIKKKERKRRPTYWSNFNEIEYIECLKVVSSSDEDNDDDDNDGNYATKFTVELLTHKTIVNAFA